jgi:dCMP deaminase
MAKGEVDEGMERLHRVNPLPDVRRPTVGEVLMHVASEFGKRSTCPRAQVGAVAARERRIVATGYVGAPSGERHCLEVGCDLENGVCIRTVHAEANLVAFAAKAGVALQGSVVYCTHSPCYSCAKLLINAGILEFYYNEEYHDPRGLQLLQRRGVKIGWKPWH